MDITELEGHSYGPHPMRVCVEKVAEFVDVTGGDTGRWVNAAPPGYLAAALFVVAPDLLDQLVGFSVIHGDQSFSWHLPLEMESDLAVSGVVSRVRQRGETFFVNFEMEVRSGDALAAEGSSLFLVAEVSPDGTPAERQEAPTSFVEDRGVPAPGQISASRADLVRYAAATRDWNPIHWDHGAATAAGLDGVVVHGLLQAAWALDAATRSAAGDQPLVTAKLRFKSPLRPAHPVDVRLEETSNGFSASVDDGSITYLAAAIETAPG